MATICTTTIFAHTNINKLRPWAASQDTPPEHPLLFTMHADAPELDSDFAAAYPCPAQNEGRPPFGAAFLRSQSLFRSS